VNDCHFGYITKSLKETLLDTKNRLVSPKPEPRTTLVYNKTGFDNLLALGPGGFLKNHKTCLEALQCGSKESKKGGSKNLP
jgi:hypothetical protein